MPTEKAGQGTGPIDAVYERLGRLISKKKYNDRAEDLSIIGFSLWSLLMFPFKTH